MSTKVVWYLLLAVTIQFIGCAEVHFGDVILETSNDTDANVRDRRNTGSYLFKIENQLEYDDSISLNIKIKDLMTSGSPYFRSHPVFIRCLQGIITNVQNMYTGNHVTIERAYKTIDQIGSSTKIQDVYATTGTGAILSVADENGVKQDAIRLAQTATFFCPSLFASERQYIGLILQSDSLHIHMTGASSERRHHFSVDGYAGKNTQEFSEWAQDMVNSALDPNILPDCSIYPEVSGNTAWPPGVASAEQAVGSADSDVADLEDAKSRLVLYPGSHASYTGTGEFYISPRMYDVLRNLQLIVKENGDQLKTEKVYAAESGLHLEGRMGLFSSKNGGLTGEKLSQFAICAGADYVRNQGNSILVAVKKQKSIVYNRVKFPIGELVEVAPPPAEMQKLGQDEDHVGIPVIDTRFQQEKPISDLSQLKQYLHPSSRYARLHPAIVQCYDNLLRYEKKWNKGADVGITIVQAFVPANELIKQFDPEHDPRGHTFSQGRALLLKYANGLDPIKYDVKRIVSAAIHQCAPVFNDQIPSRGIAIGFYDNGVYIGMGEDFLLWFGDSISPPDGMDQGEYVEQMDYLYRNAIIGRVVDPENPDKACSTNDVPKPQSHGYRYVHPAHIERKRKRRQAGTGSEEDCKVRQDTAFCQRSQEHRQIQIDHLWEQFNYLHMHSKEYKNSLKAALDGCFGICGTCRLGEVYEEKVEHCNNLLHWLDVKLLNDKPDVTNFFHLKNYDTRNHACKGAGRHCVVNTPIYAMLASSVYTLFRPDPSKSIEEELYGLTDNPSPIPELIYEIYAISAVGNVTVWVHDETEVKFLYAPLKVAMLHNRNVSNINVHVVKQDAADAVNTALESMISDWVTSGCPLHSRNIIAPYTITTLAEGTVVKRDVTNYEDFSPGEQFLLRRDHWEKHWAQAVMN